MKSTYSFALLLAAFAIAGGSFLKAADTTSMLNSADEKFVKQAAMDGKFVVQVSELGVKKAQGAEVKTVAEQMVKDHTAVNTELAALAKAKGLALSAAGDPDADKVIVKLEKEATGPDFDKAFLKQLETSHRNCVEAYETASKDSKDIELKAWADKTLPTLRAHLAHVGKMVEMK